MVNLSTLILLGEFELKKRSQSVQRELPRPYDVNMSVLRPMGVHDPALNELQKVKQVPFLLSCIQGIMTRAKLSLNNS